jgi:hypothetical protein
VSDDERRFRPVSPRVQPRFAGVSTFLRLPQHDDPADVDVLVCGAPFDGGTTFRPGARFGPRAVRSASALTRGFHPEAGFDLFDALRCADGGDVACVPMSMERTQLALAARAKEIAAAGAVPAFVGGDHSVSLGLLRGLAELSKAPEFGITSLAVRWSQGARFTELLEMSNISEGDLVRTLRMSLQLMRQLRRVLDQHDELGERLRAAAERMDRDVVDARRQLELG